jgi:CDP-glucose 4,6-dehydratase
LEDMVLNRQFGGVYAGRRVLVTGHTGFKGSWLCLWLYQLGAEVTGLALDPATDPAHWSELRLARIKDMRLNLHDRKGIASALEQIQPEIVFHLAAQPLVRRSYSDPLGTFQTNVLGLVHLFEAIRKVPTVKAVVNATTDKVYLEQDTDNGYDESHPLGGHDPYSTSKACAELISDCYRKSFFAANHVRIATARAGNVIGGGDWSEDRLIPDLIRATRAGIALRLRNPDAIRPWQHVLEPLSGYLQLGQHLLQDKAAEGAWNFGPYAESTVSVRTVISKMSQLWPDLRSEVAPEPHLHEAKILQLDCRKAEHQLSWHPIWNIEQALQRTTRWYRDYYEHNRISSQTDLEDYAMKANAEKLAWAS